MPNGQIRYLSVKANHSQGMLAKMPSSGYCESFFVDSSNCRVLCLLTCVYLRICRLQQVNNYNGCVAHRTKTGIKG